MKKIVFFMFLLLFMAPVFSVKDKESLMIDYNFIGKLLIEYTKPESFFLNYTAYVVPQGVEVVEQSLKNADIFGTEETSLGMAFEEPRNEIEWNIKQKFKIKRNIPMFASIPEFPYDVENYPENVSKYLKFYNYTNVNDAVRNKADEIVSGSENYVKAVQKILEWVNTNIEYYNSSNLVEATKEATWVLENEKGVCDEFSTLTISLLRSLGMPARYVYGYAWSNLYDGFGPHAWVEIWVPNYGWISSDPTFGQFGWIDSGHIKFYSSEDSSGTILNAVYMESMHVVSEIREYGFGESVKEVSITSMENETKTISGNLSLSRETAGTNDYVYLKLDLNNPTQYYIPSTLYTVKTKEIKFVDGSGYKDVLINPGENTFYVLVKTPDESGMIHPFSVYVPLAGEFEKNLTVFSSQPKTSLEEINLEISSEGQEIKELEIKSVKLAKVLYENPLEVNLTLRNKGNAEISNLLIEVYSSAFDKISYEVDKLRINEEKNIALKINTSLEFGEKEAGFYFTFEGRTKNEKLSFTIAEKPEIKLYYDGKTEFLEEENIVFTLMLNNTKNVYLSTVTLNILVNKENITKTYNPQKNSMVLPVTLDKEAFVFGENNLQVKIIYFDEYGLKGEIQQEYIITRTPTNILTIIVEKLKEFFILVVNFFKNLFRA